MDLSGPNSSTLCPVPRSIEKRKRRIRKETAQRLEKRIYVFRNIANERGSGLTCSYEPPLIWHHRQRAGSSAEAALGIGPAGCAEWARRRRLGGRTPSEQGSCCRSCRCRRRRGRSGRKRRRRHATAAISGDSKLPSQMRASSCRAP